MSKENDWRKTAKGILSLFGQEFDAFPVQNDDNFFIADWKDKNGLGNLATRYILDKKKGTLIITGDSGDCIAAWYSAHTPEEIAGYLNDSYYFISKIQCTTNKYVYESDDVKADVNEFRNEILEIIREPGNGILNDNGNEISEEECNEDFDEMISILDYMYLTEHTYYSEELSDLLNKYSTEWWERTRFGQRIDTRIYIWMYGFQECVRRLLTKGEN